MKSRIMLFIVLLSIGCNAFSQKKEINTARDWVKKGKNLEKAELSMRRLLEDSANQRNTKIWDVLFESLRKQYQVGNEKLYLKHKYDTVSLFNTTSRMFSIMVHYDSIDVLPDKKGRVKMTCRKANAELLNTIRPNLYNGGVFLISKQKYPEAYTMLDQYLATASQPMFKGYDYGEKDKNIPTVSYWAMYCGYKMNDTAKVLRHAPLALQDSLHHEMAMQYLSETYMLMRDTSNYVRTLKKGFEQYPRTTFFYSHLVDFYSRNRQWEKALDLTNRALDANKTQKMYHITKSSLLLNLGKYKEGFDICDSLLQVGDSLPEAYLNAGLAKFNAGVTIEKLSVKSNRPKKDILKLYQEALPYLQTYRKLCPEKLDVWGLPLYTIYLSLNMGKEFDEIDRLIKK